MVSSVDHTPAGMKWEFDERVAACFDDMLARSIPAYDQMRAATLAVGSRFVRPGTAVFDLGCSRGGALLPFAEKFGRSVKYVGAEVSPPMRSAAASALKAAVGAGGFSVQDCDLRSSFPSSAVPPSLILSVLTLQFVPIEYRQQVVAKAFRALVPGGALLLVEKVLGGDAYAQELVVELYHDRKRAAGYSQESVDAKRRSLEGVLVPLTAAGNESLLRAEGFEHVECFWRLYNFAAWVAVKPEAPPA